MKFKIISLLLSGLLALSGCATSDTSTGPDIPPEPLNSEPAEIQPTPGELPQVEEPALAEDGELNPLQGLIRDQYDGLTISAAVLPRMAILPGSAIPVNVVVENKGEQTVAYVLGSGSYETPDALLVQSDNLQPVLFRDRVGGITTMDYVVQELEPGETLEFQVYVMAVEPLTGFRDHTYDFYETDGLYIADGDIDCLQELYPDLIPVQPGSYTVQVSFLYGLLEEEGTEENMPLFAEATGYTQTELQISVTD